MRVLALYLPRLGVQLLRAADPVYQERPVGLLAGEGDGALVTTVSVEGTADGVEPGMTALQARQRCPGLLLEPDNAAACLDALEHLVSILRSRTTTDVAIVSRNAVTLDLAGVTGRFTDEATAAQAILTLARSWSGLDVRAAVASDVETAVCAASRTRRHPVLLEDEPKQDSRLPVYSPVSAAYRAARPLSGEMAEARLAKMLGSLRPLVEVQRQSYRAVRVEAARGPYRTAFVVRAGAPFHEAAEAAALVRGRVRGELDGVTELRVALERPGPSVSVAPWRPQVTSVHELSAPAIPVQRRLLLRAS